MARVFLRKLSISLKPKFLFLSYVATFLLRFSKKSERENENEKDMRIRMKKDKKEERIRMKKDEKEDRMRMKQDEKGESEEG